MNGLYGINEAEAFEETLDEAFDDAFEEGFEERRGRRRGRPVSTARGASAYQPRPSPSVVTEARLKDALQRVSQQMTINSNAIKMVDQRVRTVAAEQTRAGDILKKGYGAGKKDILAVRKDLQQTREVSAMMPILSMLAPGNQIAAFAPLLLLGNDVSQDPTTSGQPASSGGFLGGLGGGPTGMIALLALSGALAPPKP